MKRVFLTILVAGTLAACTHSTTVVNVGDYGRGLPTHAEMNACIAHPGMQSVDFNLLTNTWTCSEVTP